MQDERKMREKKRTRYSDIKTPAPRFDFETYSAHVMFIHLCLFMGGHR